MVWEGSTSHSASQIDRLLYEICTLHPVSLKSRERRKQGGQEEHDRGRSTTVSECSPGLHFLSHSSCSLHRIVDRFLPSRHVTEARTALESSAKACLALDLSHRSRLVHPPTAPSVGGRISRGERCADITTTTAGRKKPPDRDSASGRRMPVFCSEYLGRVGQESGHQWRTFGHVNGY